MTSRYYNCPARTAVNHPIPKNTVSKELIGVANTFGRYLPLQNRMVLNNAASAASYLEQTAESARIRTAMQHRSTPPASPNPTAASDESAGSFDIEQRLRALEAAIQKEAAPKPKTAQQAAPIDASVLSSLLSGQNPSGISQLSTLIPVLMQAMGQNGHGDAGTATQTLLPFLLQAMSTQNGGGGNPSGNAMLPLLIQAMGMPHR